MAAMEPRCEMNSIPIAEEKYIVERSGVIIIPNIKNYFLEIINGELKLTHKEIYATKTELLEMNITHSKIEECEIINNKGEVISKDRTKYRSARNDIYHSTPNPIISEHSTCNWISTKKHGEKGYWWCEDIGMSVQNKDAKGTLREILKMTEVNNFTIKLTIKLKNGVIVHLKDE